MLTYAPLNFIAIGIGATLGAWLRWVLGLRLNGAGWPWGTLTANLVGGYLIGVMVALIASHPEWPAWIRLAAVTGFLGGLTTFSTFRPRPSTCWSGVSTRPRRPTPARAWPVRWP